MVAMTENKLKFTLKILADGLLGYMTEDFADGSLNGGILCPACHTMHGRIADAAYPLTLLTSLTGEEKYAEAAKKFVVWSEENCVMPDGGYRNDAANGWEGVTAFSCIGYEKCLIYCRAALDDDFENILTSAVKRQLSMLDGLMEKLKPVVNYRAGTSLAYALGYRLFGNERYLRISEKWEKSCREFVTESGLLRGEGTPCSYVSPRSFVPVDIAYNAEETLPSLICACREVGDSESLAFWIKCAETHAEFMLPDGAWDGGFGSRRYKWSYYGSRTADGIQTARCTGSESPILAEASHRNALLIESLIHRGLVTGGAMFREAGEPTCLHHTFCRMKSFADVLTSGDFSSPAALPSDGFCGEKRYPEIGVYRVGRGNMRVSLACNDVEYAGDCVGNSLALAWHKRIGAVFSATMPDYRLIEPQNMQLSRKHDLRQSGTLRLETTVGGTPLDSVRDKNARLFLKSSDEKCAAFVSEGHFCGRGETSEYRFRIEYGIRADSITVKASVDCDCRLILPIIASYDDKVCIRSGTDIYVERGGVTVSVESESGVFLSGGANNRIFSPVGGFLYAQMYAEIRKGKETEVKVIVV